MSAEIYLGLGSNLGDRPRNLRRALDELASRGVRWRERSLCYETEPVGPRQPPYLNAVCRIDTRLDPAGLLEACLAAEEAMGRVRSVRWGPRVIDLDILLFGDRVVSEPRLTIPHPRLGLRRFVLEPLCELAPDVRDPASGRTVGQLLAACPDRSVVVPAGGELQWRPGAFDSV